VVGGHRGTVLRNELADRIPRRVAVFRRLGAVFRGAATAAAVGILALAVGIAALLADYSLPAFRRFGFAYLTKPVGDASTGIFHVGPLVFGTLLTSGLALLMAVPIGLGVALFSSEIAPPRLRSVLAYLVDLGATIPSVVYGFWGLVVLVPFMATEVEPKLTGWTHGGGGLFSGLPLGLGILTAGVILAVMIIPTISAVAREALLAVPRERREAALGLGATRWEATRMAVLGPATPGIVGGVVLGLGRALGETIAVALVIGASPFYPTSLFSPGYTIPSFIVDKFDSAAGLGLSSLFELGLILFALSLAINLGARLTLLRPRSDDERRWSRRRRPIRIRPRVATTPASGIEALPWWPRVLARRAVRIRRRRLVYWALVAVLAGSVVVAVYPLVSLTRVAVENGGAAVVHPSFYTDAIPPECLYNCSLGGIGPAIQGTLVLVGLAAAISIPFGLLVGVYLSEYGRGRFARAIGIVVDAMLGIPSLLIGVFVFAMFLQYDRIDVYTVLAGGIALSVLMLPIVARATETALQSVPASVRESALALGFPRHRVLLRVVLGTARSALVTGYLLALGRATGETAALLFTVGWYTYGFTGWNHPVASLAPFIYEALTNGSFPNWVTDAWGAALVLLLIIFGVTLAARLALRTEQATGAE
jgi:phosphate transport system permease protein